MLPKTLRIIVWASPQGHLTAYRANDLRNAEKRRMGWQPIIHFRAPLRRLCKGWNDLYQYAALRLVRMYGL